MELIALTDACLPFHIASVQVAAEGLVHEHTLQLRRVLEAGYLF